MERSGRSVVLALALALCGLLDDDGVAVDLFLAGGDGEGGSEGEDDGAEPYWCLL